MVISMIELMMRTVANDGDDGDNDDSEEDDG